MVAVARPDGERAWTVALQHRVQDVRVLTGGIGPTVVGEFGCRFGELRSCARWPL